MSTQTADNSLSPPTSRPDAYPSPFGPKGRRVFRFMARLFNPLVLRIAGNRWMPLVGVVHHRGHRTGKAYTTPLAMRPDGDSFLLPLTLGDESHWYRNVRAAGFANVTYLGKTYKVGEPQVVGMDSARSAYPRYEQLLFRVVGIQHFLRLQKVGQAA